MIGGSLFEGVRDRQPWHLPQVGFDELVKLLIETATDSDPSEKTEQTCVSPATYGRGKTRSRENAISWNWFAGDIDNKHGNCFGTSMDEAIAVLDGLGAAWFAYTTASSQPDAECFRIMFPLDRPVPNAEFADVWQAFSRMLPLDPATKDISRIFIVPRHWRGRVNRMEHDLTGLPVCVDEVLRRFPAPQLKEVSRPTASKVSDIPRRSDCPMPSLDAPYVPDTALAQALSAPSGGRMYRFLVAVAFSALRLRYDISVADLEAIGRELAFQLGRNTSDIARDARRAHDYAASHHVDHRAERRARLHAFCCPRSLRGYGR